MTIAGKPQKGNFKYFTRWDLKATGGRFFESNIISGAENSHMFTVKAHDGDVGTYPFTEIFQIGIGAQIGDDVIAYFDGRPYAFKGKATMVNDGKFFVEFDDCGDKAWVDPTKVYKMVSLSIAGKAQKGDYNYFVRWDDNATCGRYLECNVIGMWGINPGQHNLTVQTYNGEEGEFTNSEVFEIGTAALEGDDVIAYPDNVDDCAYKGTVIVQKDAKSFIKFENGDSNWVETSKVYKMVE